MHYISVVSSKGVRRRETGQLTDFVLIPFQKTYTKGNQIVSSFWNTNIKDS